MTNTLKKTVALTVVIATIFLFASCGRQNVVIETSDVEENTTVVTEKKAETTTAEFVKVETVVESTVFTTEAPRFEEPEVVTMGMTPYRNKLSIKEKELYDKIYAAIYSYAEFSIDPINGKYNEDNFHNAVDALRGDNPQLWLFMYITNEYASEADGGHATKMSVVPSYNWRYEDVEFHANYMDSYLESMNEICDQIISRMPQDATLEEKYEFLGREICNRTIYVDKSENEELYETETGDRASWAYCYMNGPFLYGEGLCQAYAQSYQYLCNRAGLWCICTGGGCHEWNLVMLEDGSTYHVDLTWADTEWEEDGFDESYFLLTQEEIEIDHFHEDSADWAATGK